MWPHRIYNGLGLINGYLYLRYTERCAFILLGIKTRDLSRCGGGDDELLSRKTLTIIIEMLIRPTRRATTRNDESSQHDLKVVTATGKRGYRVYVSRCILSACISHLSSRCRCRSTVRRSSDARCRSCRRSSRLAPGPCTWLRNPTPCLPCRVVSDCCWVDNRVVGRGLFFANAPLGGGGSIRGLRFSPRARG